MELALSTEDITRPSSITKSSLVDLNIFSESMFRLKLVDSTTINQSIDSASVAMHVASALPVRPSLTAVSLLDRAAQTSEKD